MVSAVLCHLDHLTSSSGHLFYGIRGEPWPLTFETLPQPETLPHPSLCTKTIHTQWLAVGDRKPDPLSSFYPVSRQFYSINQSQHSCHQLSPLWQLHSSTSSFAQVCFPHSLVGLDPKSAPTPSWTPCIQISVAPGLVFQGTKPEITAITCLFRCSRWRDSQSPKALSIISASKPLKYKRTKWW